MDKPVSVDVTRSDVGGRASPVADDVIHRIRRASLAGIDAGFVEIEHTSVHDDGPLEVAVVSAAGFDAHGGARALGLAVGAVHDGEFWLQFWRDLRARGLRGVQLVVSPAFLGLPDALARVFPDAVWIATEGSDETT